MQHLRLTKKLEPKTDSESLAHVQTWLQHMLLSPFAPAPEEPVERHIKAGPRLAARRHLQIYRQSYIARLRECMKKQFACLAYTLGNELFENFADEYLSKHPSNSYSLNTLGINFAAYLQANRPDASEAEKEDWPDFMIDLAEFEYALAQLFDEAGPENGALIVRAFKHRFNIAGYYLAFSNGQNPDMCLPQTSYCKVIRENYRLAIYEITESEYKIVQGYS